MGRKQGGAEQLTHDRDINVIGNVSGSNVQITQVYAPGAITLRPKDLPPRGDAPPFSVEWLLFSEASVPFQGRDSELARLQAMLDDERTFLWWTIVGSGGAGKNRLALELLLRNEAQWAGGFLESRGDESAVAAWVPDADTIWIIDYAAEDANSLRRTIPLFRAAAEAHGRKVRLLLLERGFDAESGWWNDLLRWFGPHQASIRCSLFAEPLELGAIKTTARQFLHSVAERLPADLAEQLNARITELSDEELEAWCDGTNPLIAQMFASRLVNDKSPLEKHASPQAILERYFVREVERLRRRLRAAELLPRPAICLLFMTTSAFPFPLITSGDLVFGNGALIPVVLSPDGPSVLDEAGTEPLNDRVREHNAQLIELLESAIGADDVWAYLAALEEAGYSRATRWSMQPDLLGEMLIAFVINSPAISRSVRAHRPGFDQTEISRLAEHAVVTGGLERSCANWARLDDVTLLRLLERLREAGKSPRFSLTIARVLNWTRDRKLAFDPVAFLRQCRSHQLGKELASTYHEAKAFISRESWNGSAAAQVAASPHAWILSYLFYLEDLSRSEQVRLARTICLVRAPAILTRLTNASILCEVVERTLSAIVSDRSSDKWSSLAGAAATLAAEALDFVEEALVPARAASAEDPLDDLDEGIGRILMSISYGLLRGRFGSADTSGLKQRVSTTIKSVDGIPKGSWLRALLARNRAALDAESARPGAFGQRYLQAIQEIAAIGSAEELTNTFSDALYVSVQRCDRSFVAAAPHLIESLPKRLLNREDLASAVSVCLGELGKDGRDTSFRTFVPPLVDVSFRLLRRQDDDWVYPLLSAILDNALQLTLDDNRAHRSLLTSLSDALASCRPGATSPAFELALVGALMHAHLACPKKVPQPTGAHREPVGQAEWERALAELEPAEAASIKRAERIVLTAKNSSSAPRTHTFLLYSARPMGRIIPRNTEALLDRLSDILAAGRNSGLEDLSDGVP